jgi:DMSO/TMAO reductase YedYZ molybdopterin-dependent catalytic subunit/membrane protein DedA with SNARE-associated domain
MSGLNGKLSTEHHVRLITVFLFGSVAGLIATLIQYFGGQALNIPFPPEEVFRVILYPVPGSLQSVAVDKLGEYAKYAAFTASTLGYILLYGALIAGLSKLRLRPKLSVPIVFIVMTVLGLVCCLQLTDSYSLLSTTLGWALSVALLMIGNVFFAGIFMVSIDSVRAKAIKPQLPTQQPVSPRRDFLKKAIGAGIVAVAAIVGIDLGLPLFSGQPLSGGGNPIPLNPETTSMMSATTLLTSASAESSTLATTTSEVTSASSAGLAPVFMDPRISDLINSEVTNNLIFYRVDIDPEPPELDFDRWSLGVNGTVMNPFTFKKQDLLSLETIDEYVTLECISNTVNPPSGLISNAKWTGVPLNYLLNRAGYQSIAKSVIFHCAEGYAVGIPFDVAMRPDTILAYKMNNEMLPTEHGFPLRAIVPGIYGMMNAKWITSIEVSDSVFLGYWQTRGWSNDAKINTTSIIYYPSQLIANGGLPLSSMIPIAGVAFAGDKGISKVEVSTDGGSTWNTAYLKPPLSPYTWVIWAYPWSPPGKGQYQIMVRATDGTGILQNGAGTDTFPNGATGYNVVTVYIT